MVRGAVALFVPIFAVGCVLDFGATAPPVSRAIDAGVSATHDFPAGTGPIDGLELRASGHTATLVWTVHRERRGLRTLDAGHIFSPAIADELNTPGAAPTKRTLETSRLQPATWQVARPEGRQPWTFDAPALAQGTTPVAVDEDCGLVAVVTAEQTPSEVALVLRRYLPPRGGSGVGANVGLPIDVGRAKGLSRSPVVAALPEAVLVAWHDAGLIRAVRVELPDVICGLSQGPRR